MDPATMTLIAQAVASAAQAGGQALTGRQADKASRRRAKETRRETEADVLDQAMQRSAELEAHNLGNRKRSGKRRAQSMQETSDLVRGALNI
jgi:hypothetical protein